MTAFPRPTSTAFASVSPHNFAGTFKFNHLASHSTSTSAFPLRLSVVQPSRRSITVMTHKQPNTSAISSSSSAAPASPSSTTTTTPPALSRRRFLSTLAATVAAFSPSFLSPLSVNTPPALAARPEGVNRPELLPVDFTTVIDLERFLASGEAKRLRDKISDLEQRTGVKLRILTQRFPQTPGLAIRDYWGVDADTIVCVADYFGGSGQLLKFNVGANVDRVLAPRFWSVLSASYGNKFYVSKNGEAASIINAVDAIRYCLLRDGCVTPPRDISEVIF